MDVYLVQRQMNTGNRRRDNSMGLVNFLSKSSIISLDAYIAISTIVTIIGAGSVATAFHSQPELQRLLEEELKNNTRLSDSYGLNTEHLSTLTSFQVVHYVLSDSVLIWVAINYYFTMLAIATRVLIKVVFKELSRQEETMARHAFFSYCLLSVVYLAVVMNPQQSNRVLPWMVWTGLCGFLSSMHFITCQRLKYISPSVGQGGWKMTFLSMFLFVVSIYMSVLVLKFQHHLTWQPALLLYIDCLLAIVRSTYILLRCMSSSRLFSSRPDSVRHFNYWLELGTNITCEFLQMLNYAQLTLVSPGLNLTCIFFIYHIKLTYSCMIESLNRHKSHKRIFAHIETTYPSVKCENSDDRCVVCWELLGESRRLPCSHQFHDWCLMWWMAQDSSCPTCRVQLPSPLESTSSSNINNNNGGGLVDAITAEQTGNNTTFRFNGGNFAFVRLPPFTIEISTGLGPIFGQISQPTEEQLQSMLEQVREMFPQMSADTILQDLRGSGSAQSTIENILEGRIGWNMTSPLLTNVLENDETEESETENDFEESLETSTESNEGRERTWTKSESSEELSYFEIQRAKMIETYRKKYLASEKAADLREKGILE
ncbi:unnamed protein product [Caenorhabditis angaria]|uniref:RING-type domain-containing protein n=1 Tax=Caenorhabditis angaria TaxID=860376 RepID=A0A9P1I9K0_9PELO|nr:unnamed protein product [Caenorhabditis angaria]